MEDLTKGQPNPEEEPENLEMDELIENPEDGLPQKLTTGKRIGMLSIAILVTRIKSAITWSSELIPWV